METETKPLGALLPGIVGSQTGVTVSPAPSTTALASINLATLPARLDDGMMAMLRELVNSPLPVPERCDEIHFGRCMKSLDILPRRADDSGGNLRMKLYQAKLSGFSNGALSYLVEYGLERFHWFPSIAECLEVLKAFPNRERDGERKQQARHLMQREMNARMDEAIERLAGRNVPQGDIDAMPGFWKRVGADKGYLWAWPDGRFTVRRDLSAMAPEAADAEREAVAAMLAEWEVITAAQGDDA